MKIQINVNDYDCREGLKLTWKDNYKIECNYDDGEIIILANEAGLMSLANHLVSLAQRRVPSGTHIHLDEDNSLEEGSKDIVIQKID
ncbi:MAG: hypothetical protein K6G65_07725 [Lachnospiraceae bacterium]|nr:hypothetical protein [Lachnospiraceae bacterium]